MRANRSDQLENNSATRYGIASGCKLFTAIAVCQLVEEGEISFETKLNDCLDMDFRQFDDRVTVHHLLTHTSGIPDYFDEDVMDDFEEIWEPNVSCKRVKRFLTIISGQSYEKPTRRIVSYYNAGYILLGLIVEEASEL
ncbi:serine hydrolase domain-containing protein [Virgibacillus sp. DJP39]|uniref:serine hydrolase domain-containing protein n=1 Tax=Virgibacillus sp. DJP39 TaxID=3409790 RepID=UPI003BB767D6